MTDTTIGSGIMSSELPETFAPEIPKDFDVMGLVDAIKQGMRSEMDAAVADIERRLGQAREIERANETGTPRETIHAEDLNLGFAMIDGYTLTANSPTAGKIAWSSLHVVLLGVDYTITNGNTDKKYTWFIKPASGTSATLMSGDTLPALGANDALIFVNNGGTPVSVLESSVSYAVGGGVVGSEQLDSGLSTLLSNLQATDIAQQAAIDGAITSYYQDSPPWAAGSPSPGGGNVNQGDIWYDSNDGGAFRWTGTGGTPANTWYRIADTDVASVAALVNTKVTTYIGAASPAAPSGGFTSGDLWIDTSSGNLTKRWSGSAWVSLQIGDAAISGVSGAKVGSGINASNVTSGVLTGSLVGSGINGTHITTGTVGGARVGSGVAPSVLTGAGTAPVGAIPQLNPAKLNTAFHMLY